MGTESVVIALAGGYTGRALADGLAAEGIESDFVWVAGETRTVVAIWIRAPATTSRPTRRAQR